MHVLDQQHVTVEGSSAAGPVRLGLGPRMWSEQTYYVPVRWCDHPLWLRASVVEKDVPCLISQCEMRFSSLQGTGPLLKLYTRHVATRLMDLHRALPDRWPTASLEQRGAYPETEIALMLLAHKPPPPADCVLVVCDGSDFEIPSERRSSPPAPPSCRSVARCGPLW